MHAALLSAFDLPPQYSDYPEPEPVDDGDMVVDVLAAGLHHLTRARATGAHYSSEGALPLVPGVDAVVRDPSGKLRYVVLDDTRLGTFADRTVIDPRRSVVLPDDIDPIRIAAAMNPAMSSWLALRSRFTMEEGQRVLVIGATGNAGRMAVQISKMLGAAHVIAAGRNAARLAPLADLGADETCMLDELERAADVDIVLDYIWGEPTAEAMIKMLTARPDRSAQLSWIQIGSMAGPTAPIPAAALRASRIQIIGSGIGSVSAAEIIAELPDLARALEGGTIDVRPKAVPLSDIASAWDTGTDERIVFVP